MKTLWLALFSMFSLYAEGEVFCPKPITSSEEFEHSFSSTESQDRQEEIQNQAIFEKYCQKFNEEMNKKEQSPYFEFYQKRLRHKQDALVRKWDQFKEEWTSLQKEFVFEAEKVLQQHPEKQTALLREKIKTLPLLKYTDQWEIDTDSFFEMLKLSLGVAPANSDKEILEYQKLILEYEMFLLFSLQDIGDDEDDDIDSLDFEDVTVLFNETFVQPFLEKASHPLLKKMVQFQLGTMPPLFLGKIWMNLVDLDEDEDENIIIPNNKDIVDSFDKLLGQFFYPTIDKSEGLLGKQLNQLYTRYSDYFFTCMTNMSLFEADFFIWILIQEGFMEIKQARDQKGQ